MPDQASQRRTGWQAFDRDDEPEMPPWAGPVAPLRPATRTEGGGGDERPPGPSRAATTRRRRSRRRMVAALGAVVIAGLTGTAVYFIFVKPSTAGGPRFVENFLPGEYRRVPNACRALPVASLHGYLGGTPRIVQTFAYADRAQCGFTVDQQPLFRVLDLTIRAYQPYLGAPGDGSATAYARFDFAQVRASLAKPAKHAPWPPAVITPLAGLGSQAFSALQVFRTGKIVTDMVTVLVRYRNVLVTARLQAQGGGGFSPAPVGQIEFAAMSAARQALGAVKAMPASA